MSQAVLQPNEFIIRVEQDEGNFIFVIRNPHDEPPNSGEFDTAAYINLIFLLKHFKSLHHDSHP